MKILFSDVSKEEELRRKEEELEAEKRRKRIYISQFNHGKPMIKLGMI